MNIRPFNYRRWLRHCIQHIRSNYVQSLHMFFAVSSKLDNWGGGGGQLYSYIGVHRPSKQSISKEMNCAEHEYCMIMNMSPSPYPRLTLPYWFFVAVMIDSIACDIHTCAVAEKVYVNGRQVNSQILIIGNRNFSKPMTLGKNQNCCTEFFTLVLVLILTK